MRHKKFIMIEEIIGHIATVFVVVSLLMSNLVLLRIFNLTGSVWFVVYGIMLQSYPVIISNSLILIINIIKLYSENRKKKS